MQPAVVVLDDDAVPRHAHDVHVADQAGRVLLVIVVVLVGVVRVLGRLLVREADAAEVRRPDAAARRGGDRGRPRLRARIVGVDLERVRRRVRNLVRMREGRVVAVQKRGRQRRPDGVGVEEDDVAVQAAVPARREDAGGVAGEGLGGRHPRHVDIEAAVHALEGLLVDLRRAAHWADDGARAAAAGAGAGAGRAGDESWQALVGDQRDRAPTPPVHRNLRVSVDAVRDGVVARFRNTRQHPVGRDDRATRLQRRQVAVERRRVVAYVAIDEARDGAGVRDADAVDLRLQKDVLGLQRQDVRVQRVEVEAE
jgi:hypothetical protein